MNEWIFFKFFTHDFPAKFPEISISNVIHNINAYNIIINCYMQYIIISLLKIPIITRFVRL